MINIYYPGIGHDILTVMKLGMMLYEEQCDNDITIYSIDIIDKTLYAGIFGEPNTIKLTKNMMLNLIFGSQLFQCVANYSPEITDNSLILKWTSIHYDGTPINFKLIVYYNLDFNTCEYPKDIKDLNALLLKGAHINYEQFWPKLLDCGCHWKMVVYATELVAREYIEILEVEERLTDIQNGEEIYYCGEIGDIDL